MRIDFEEQVPVSPDTVYGFFRTPADWPRLYRAMKPAKPRRNGWYAVPLRRFPMPLVTRITADDPGVWVAWEFGGFFDGEAEVRFDPRDGGTVITGFEEISVPRLAGLGPRLERRFLDARFRALWGSGRRRLRQMGSDQAL